jgi:hypothetical protein
MVVMRERRFGGGGRGGMECGQGRRGGEEDSGAEDR